MFQFQLYHRTSSYAAEKKGEVWNWLNIVFAEVCALMKTKVSQIPKEKMIFIPGVND